ncbi:MAG TPA: YncE family protein [Thermoanaerobaculia bacterium]|nr:YncE family protein [Thermoanaerobaculia bacterium]
MRPIAIALSVFALALPLFAADGTYVAKKTDAGLSVELRLQNNAGAIAFRENDPVSVDLKITDAGGQPVPGLAPAAWMAVRSDAGGAKYDRCTGLVATFLGATLMTRPEVDLNTYHVLTMNADATINVVDPHFSFGGTQLLNIVTLDAPAEDWALSADVSRLFVSTPKSGEVAFVDTTLWKVVKTIEAGPNVRRLALQADGHYLWAGHDHGVSVLRADGAGVAARIATAAPVTDLAVADNAYAVALAGTKATVISVRTLKATATIEADAPLVSAAYSPRAGAFYLAAKSGSVYVVDPKRGRVANRIKATAEPVQIRFEPEGRLAFVVNRAHKLVEIIDSASNNVIQTADVGKDPDRVSFSNRLAYVRNLGSDIVLTIPLDKIGTPGEPVPVIDVPAGQEAFGAGVAPSIADGIVAAGEEDAVLIAHPVDRMIYYYREGMAAPMGHFANDGHVPRAVMVLDRGLRERKPGEFHTTTHFPRAGTYDVAVFVAAPRIVTCFELPVAENEVLRAERMKPLRVEAEKESMTVKSGAPVRLRFRLTDQASHPRPDLRDVTAMVTSAGSWNDRLPATSLGNGVYEIEVTPPADGFYSIFIECPSAGLTLNKGRMMVLDAKS